MGVFKLEQNLKSEVSFLPIKAQLKELSNFYLLIFEGFLVRLGKEKVGKGI